MPFHVLSAPHPPQVSLPLTLTDLARRDARFSHTGVLRTRGILGQTVQDSADLQDAHLTLRHGRREWSGTPRGLPQQASHAAPFPRAGWSESALSSGLGLDLGHTDVRTVSAEAFFAEVNRWSGGAVYTFCVADGEPTLARRLNLSTFIDRVECDFLAAVPGTDLALVRAHRLIQGGRMEVLRASWWEG